MSLKLRLTLFSTVLMIITLTLISLVSYHYVAGALNQQLDAALEDRAAEVLDDIAQMGSRFYSDPSVQIAQSARPQTVPVYVEIVDHLDTVRFSSDPPGRPLLPIDKNALHHALKGSTFVQDEPAGTSSGLRVRYAPLPSPDKSLMAVLEVGTPLGATDNTLSLLRLVLVSTILASSALVGLGVWLTASRTLAAVDRVTRTAQNIAVSRSLGQRIPEDPGAGADEMGRLVRTFNRMLDRLAAAFAAQRQFVADSSHELRSPLTVIRGNLDLLRRTHDPAERNAIERLIEDEAARMSRLVNNLLFLAQLEDSEGEAVPLDRRPVELDSLLLKVYQQARAMTDRHTILLGDEDAITIDGDPDQLQQLLLNLVDNAIKYTPPGGTIVLSLRSVGDAALLEVRDTGIGIPAADLPHVFDRFYRVDKVRSRRSGGAGLGLSIVREIATSHGGAVMAESVVGQGSTFQVRLPRTGAVPPEPVVPRGTRNGYAGGTALTANSSTAASVVSAGKGPH